ncbi:unnamed protein product [Symbiodinium pilosum]|uniref:Uncharacterized protein n=1 Tax=Symbiodinium pilosum TaxID=2952 RepID=A0A812W7X2_SYMPI|nr:unnamed protein product [Symbiodinium pilosum]
MERRRKKKRRRRRPKSSKTRRWAKSRTRTLTGFGSAAQRMRGTVRLLNVPT